VFHHNEAASAETIGALNTGVDTVNLRRPTLVKKKNREVPELTSSSRRDIASVPYALNGSATCAQSDKI